jgi:hypothetical protein
MGSVRNEKCACGSGKKFKKCCLITGITSQDLTIAKPKKPTHVFSRVSTMDLLRTFSAVSIFPSNHGKNVRLEALVELAFENANPGAQKMDRSMLLEYVHTKFSFSQDEERPINFFTENITTTTGDNIIFPGITESATFILSNLLAAIFHWPNSGIDSKYRERVEMAVLLMVFFSNQIAQRLDYGRLLFPEDITSEIVIPDEGKLEELKAAVTFSKQDVAAWMKRFGIHADILNSFLLKPGEFRNVFTGELEFLKRPLMPETDSYIVISPTTISLALVNFIWNQAAQMGIMPTVNKAFHSLIWNNLNMDHIFMGFKHIEIPETRTLIDKPDRLSLLQFDEDKIAILHMLADDGRNISNESGADLAQHQGLLLRQRVLKKIRSLPAYKNYQFLELVSLSPIGRDLGMQYLKNDLARGLTMAPAHYKTIRQSRKADSIDLWNFAGCVIELSSKQKLLNVFQIDLFDIFRRKHSLNLPQDGYQQLMLEFGISGELYRQSIKREDPHAVVTLEGGRVRFLPVVRQGKSGPIYFAPGELLYELIFFVEELPFSLTVSPSRPGVEIPSKLKSLFWQLTDALAYWLWQASPSIKPHLTKLGNQPIKVVFDISSDEAFANMARDYKRQPKLFEKFRIQTDSSGFKLVLPDQLIPYLYGSDNEGERIMLRALLTGFNQLLELKGHKKISRKQLDQTLELAAPLGQKKKVFILDSGNNILLDPKNLVDYRLVQNFEIEKIEDSLLPNLGKDRPAIGIINNLKKKKQLIDQIINRNLYPKLKNLVSQLNSVQLLEKLISINETLIRKREKTNLLIPTRIACFVSDTTLQKELIDTLSDINHTLISLRCLIEFLLANPSNETRNPSKTDIDELVAVMDQIIYWGGVEDQMNYNLFQTPIQITANRIHVDSLEQRASLSPYQWTKMGEHIVDAKQAFDHFFPKKDAAKGKDVPIEVDEAFIEEFGISFTRICGFINALGVIAYQQTQPFAKLPLNQLRAKINEIEPAFGDLEFTNGLNFLSLSNEFLQHQTTDAHPNDRLPWRFNRRLSYMRRPLCILGTAPVVYWGLRQVVASRTYLYEQCQSNRLRVREKGPVEKVLTSLSTKASAEMVSSVIGEFNNPELVIDLGKYIGPGKDFEYEKNLGDVDVLIIDPQSKTLFSLECKNMAASRSFKEMVEEVGKLFEKRWIEKHMERHRWISTHLDQIEDYYQIQLESYQVKSIFITAEEMLTPYLSKHPLPLPFITLYTLKDRGMASLIAAQMPEL